MSGDFPSLRRGVGTCTYITTNAVTRLSQHDPNSPLMCPYSLLLRSRRNPVIRITKLTELPASQTGAAVLAFTDWSEAEAVTIFPNGKPPEPPSLLRKGNSMTP